MTVAAWEWHGHAFVAALVGFLIAWLLHWWFAKRGRAHEVVHRRVVETSNDESTKLRTLVDDHGRAQADLVTQHDSALAAAREQHASALAALGDEHATALAGARTEHEAAIAALRSEHETSAAAASAAHADALGALNAKHGTEIEQLRSDHHGALSSAKADHDGEIARLTSDHTSALESLRTEHSGALDSLRAEHSGALDSLRAEHNGALDSLRAEHSGAFDSLRAEHSTALDAMRSEHGGALAALTEQHNAQLADRDGHLLGLRGQLEASGGSDGLVSGQDPADLGGQPVDGVHGLMGDANALPHDSALVPAEAKNADGSDNLLMIEGIGPKFNEALVRSGLTSFPKVAAASLDQLRAAIQAAGLSFAPSLDTWAEQAALLSRGDLDGFRALTDRLVAGRRDG